MKNNRHTAFYAYMEPFFEKGDSNAIAQAKKEYRRKYKAAWRNAKRKKDKEITTSWAKDEYKELKTVANHHKQNIARFVKESATAYMNQRFIYPDETLLRKTTQILELKEASGISVETTKKLLDDIYQLERDIRVTLYSPKTIEQVIKEELHKHPDDKNWLIEFIQNQAV